MKKNSLIILISLLLISVIAICTVVYIQERDIDNTIPDNILLYLRANLQKQFIQHMYMK